MLRRLGLGGAVMLTALAFFGACGGEDEVDFGKDADAAAGSAGVATGGSAGVATGGTAGAATGGSAGVATGGSAGVATGGTAGAATGGSAGAAAGGSAGAATGGSAGAVGDGGLLPLGGACTNKAQCASGNCVDDVCCDSACNGTCQACDADGACKPIAANTDPEDECGACKLCDGVGACAAVPDGTDPGDECAVQDPATCGTTGTCHAGACELYDAFTVCQKGTCSVSTLNAKLCDGKGACGAVGTVSCSPYTCNDTLDGCRTSCSTNAHCVSGVTCDVSTGICLANLPKGASCTGDSQCATGFCTDGVCCDKACSGFCEACNLAGEVGSCKAVPSGQDPDSECGGSGACNGSCDGSGGCSWPGATTVCTTQSTCLGGYTGPGQCNAYGTCALTVPCPGGFACASSTSCRTSCFYQEHCQKGYACVSSSGVGICQKGTLADGASCSYEGACLSGDCADFFSSADCNLSNACVQCDQDTDCPSGRCDGCKCEDRLKSGQNCNEQNDCLSGFCNNGTCQ